MKCVTFLARGVQALGRSEEIRRWPQGRFVARLVVVVAVDVLVDDVDSSCKAITLPVLPF